MSRIEGHTIYPIPIQERHGRARDLFTLWFGSNIMILTIATGALATVLFKLPLLDGMVAILAGNMIGGIFMALHAAQGPQLGVPQMVQSRGQFGSVGSVLVIAVVVVMYVGFVASNLVLGAQCLIKVIPGVDSVGGTVAVGAISLAAAIYGYDLIHSYGRWMSWLSGVALLVCAIWIFFAGDLPADLWERGTPTLSGFLGTISIGALWQIAYAPYVSDYSRYMPMDSGVRPTFWASYWGCVLGSVLPMLLGALLGLMTADGNVVAGLVQAAGPISRVVILIFTIGIGSTTAISLYGCVLSSITIGQTFRPRWQPGASSRIVLSVCYVALAAALALFTAKNFMANYENFLALLMCAMTPWTAINLVDYYLLQHGRYDVGSFFAADGGIYGRYNVTALFCFLFGVAVQLPFLATEIYTGPIARSLGGVDVSWLVGLLVVGPLYLFLAKRAGRADIARGLR